MGLEYMTTYQFNTHVGIIINRKVDGIYSIAGLSDTYVEERLKEKGLIKVEFNGKYGLRKNINESISIR